MAYLDLSRPQGTAIATPQDLAADADASGFSGLEWQVVAIARRDRLSSLGAPTPIARLLHAVFGGKRANPRLADPRLEALRRVAVIAWHKGFAVPVGEVAAFHDAGYSVDQLETLLTSISRDRAA